MTTVSVLRAPSAFLKSEGGRLTLAIVAVGAAIFLITKCGGQQASPPEMGHVTITVQVVPVLPAEVIPRIRYQLENARVKLELGGTLIPDDGSRATAAVRGIPAGAPWTVALAAASADGDVTCAGTASFEVLARQTTTLSTSLPCRSRSGATPVGGPGQRCHIIQSLAVAPTQTAVGSSVELTVATAAGERLGLHHAWTGPGGSFSDPGGAQTRFTCQEAGEHTLALRVWDDSCADRTTTVVRCTSFDCGNGRLDRDESCEPPGTSSCDPGCRKIAGCGNAQIDPGEGCDDGNTASGDGCGAGCTRETICGNGLIEAGEDCEPPGTGACSSVCRAMPGP